MCAKLGIKVCICAPEVDEASVDEELNQIAEATGNVTRTLNLEEAMKDADYVHTDTWMNMELFDKGKIKPDYLDEFERRRKLFGPYQINAELIEKYAPECKIMHCMPLHIGYEIARDAVSHPNSVIFDQAENRMHMQKAMILWQLEMEKKLLDSKKAVIGITKVKRPEGVS
jgi:ornithine carbamoyltransferase